MKKISITQADNGFILRIVDGGWRPLAEPYVKPLTVYPTFEELVKALENIFRDEK